jgi:tRNA(fMet)-specific endonuclease VapC
MKYLLDTNICLYLIKKKPATVLRRLLATAPGDVGISSITLSELEYGVEKSAQRDKNKLALARFVAPLEIAPYDHAACAEYGRIRTALEKAGQPIGPLDTLIAAHARSLGVVLVTNNVREFRRVPDLKINDWTQRT